MSDATPTLQQILDALHSGGLGQSKLSRDEETVVVGYGGIGYYRLIPDYVISSGHEVPAVMIEGKVTGAKHAELREVLEAAGIRPR